MKVWYNQIIPDTKKIVGEAKAHRMGKVFQSCFSNCLFFAKEEKRKHPLEIGWVSEGDTTDVVVTDDSALSKGWNSHQWFNEVICRNYTLHYGKVATWVKNAIKK